MTGSTQIKKNHNEYIQAIPSPRSSTDSIGSPLGSSISSPLGSSLSSPLGSPLGSPPQCSPSRYSPLLGMEAQGRGGGWSRWTRLTLLSFELDGISLVVTDPSPDPNPPPSKIHPYAKSLFIWPSLLNLSWISKKVVLFWNILSQLRLPITSSVSLGVIKLFFSSFFPLNNEVFMFFQY